MTTWNPCFYRHRVHGRYAQYYNTRSGRTGHLWQDRFFACVLEGDQPWAALAYVERNPLCAGMAQSAGDYRWSSAAAHLRGIDDDEILDIEWCRNEAPQVDWAETLCREDPESGLALQRCTYAGRPFGAEAFVAEMSQQLGRYWVRGRPPKQRAAAANETGMDRQLSFFGA